MDQATTPLREYETIYILKPDVPREVTEGLATRLGDVVKTEGALRRVENWGRRKLAYTVSKQKRGIYIYLRYTGSGAIVSELERTLGLQESVMKFQTVKLSDEADSGDVKAEDVQFSHVDEPDDDVEETLAQVLGLEMRNPRFSAADESDDADDDDDDDDGPRRRPNDNTDQEDE